LVSRVWRSGFGVQGLVSRVWRSGFGVQGLVSRVKGLVVLNLQTLTCKP